MLFAIQRALIYRLTSYPIEKAGFDSEGLPFFMAPPPRHERSEPRRNPVPHRLNARNSLSLVPSCHDIFFLETLPTNICLPFRKRLRGLFDFLPATQIACPPLSPETRRKTSPNPPLKDLFFARKSCRFYVPKMSLKNANGCSVCA